MPKGNPNSYAGGGFIKSMREKHEPHMKLAGRVESLEKDIPIALAGIHKTSSKSFGLQRKTLMRVIALEKKVSGITIIIEGLEDAASDAVKKPPRKKRPRKKPPKKSAKKPKPTPKDWDDEETGGWDATSGGATDEATDEASGGSISEEVTTEEVTTEEDISSSISSISSVDESTSTSLSTVSEVKEETKRIHKTISKLTGHTISVLKKISDLRKKVRTNTKKITLLKNIIKAQKSDIGKNLKSLDPVGSPLNASIQSITDSVTSIHQTLLEQQDLDKEKSEDAGIDAEQGSRDAKEKGREAEKEGGALQKTGQKMLKPVQGAFDKIKEWLIKLFAAKAIMMFMDWFSDPANAKKVQSIFRFIKDWWPAIVTGLLLFAGSMLGPTGIVIGITALVVGFVPKIVNAIKSIFGFGKDTEKEALKGEKDAAKAEALADKQDKGTAGDDLKPEDDPKDAPEPGTQETPGEKAPLKMNKGGEVPGTGDKDTVPAMLTPGEFVMSKGAVEEYGVQTLEGMNAAAGGTNIPTLQRGESGGGGTSGTGLLPRYSGGGQTMSKQLGHTRGTVTDPKEKARIEAETLEWVNKERVEFLGLPPLDKISYADGVELTKPMGKEFYGAGITEESSEDMDFNTMTKTTTRWKQRGSELIFEGATEALTEEDKQAYFDSNPVARMARDLKQQAELDDLGASISASAKMNGGGLVPAFNGGGLVPGYRGGGLINPQISAAKWLGRKAKGVFSSIKDRLSPNQAGKVIPGAPVKPTTVIAYAKEAAAKAGGTVSSGAGGPKVPSFNAGAKVDRRKVKVLGISR